MPALSNAYVAGLFDGEGWFSIRKAPGSYYGARRKWAFQCLAGLVMREKFIIEMLQGQFGGTVGAMKPRSEKHSTGFRWTVTGQAASAFAVEVGPFLVAKARQAELVIRFQQGKDRQGNQPLADSQYHFYEECWDAMHDLNAKGVGKFDRSFNLPELPLFELGTKTPKEFCNHGHLLSGDNLVMRQGRTGMVRSCRACHRMNTERFLTSSGYQRPRYPSTCECCGQPFQGRKGQKLCSRICVARWANHHRYNKAKGETDAL